MKYFKFIPLFIFLLGCQKIPNNPKFETVANEVREKTGGKVIWNLDLIDDGSVNNESQILLNKKLTIDDVVQVVLLNNRQLRVEYENVGLAYGDLKKLKFWNSLHFEGLLRFDGSTLVNIEVTFLQNLINLLYLPTKRKVSFYLLEKEKLSVINKVLGYTLTAKELFLKLQIEKQKLLIQKENFEIEDSNFLLFTELYKAGNITELQFNESKLQWDTSKFKLQETQHQIDNLQVDLNSLMNLYDGSLKWDIVESSEINHKSLLDFIDLENKIVKANYDLKMIYEDIQIESCRLNSRTLKRIIGAIDIGAIAEKDSGKWYLGPVVAIDLPALTSPKKLSSEEILFRRAWQQYTAKAIQLRNSIRKYKLDSLYTNDALQFYEKSILPTATIVFNETFKEHNAMAVTPSDLLMSKLALNEFKLNQLELILNSKIQEVRLHHLLLGGSDQSIREGTIIQDQAEVNFKKHKHY